MSSEKDLTLKNKNYFNSQIIKEIEPQDIKKEKKEIQNDKIKKLFKCSLCKNVLEKPMFDPSCCEHFACEKCLDYYFKSQKKKMLPCPICKNNIKKQNIIEIPIISPIIEKLKELYNSQDDVEFSKIEQKCEIHPNNNIFSICLECRKKMCPICFDEKKKHNDHQVVNYERYIKLFYYFQDNYKNLYKTINDKENNIEELINLNLLLEKQKNVFSTFFNDCSKKIQVIYSKNQENLNKIIEETKETIEKIRNFMKNLKMDISSKFKKSYDDIENLQQLQDEIKQKIDKLKIKQINKNFVINLKNKYIKNLYELPKKQVVTTLNKKLLFDNSRLSNKIDEQGNYNFGIELSEDKNIIKIYLDINKTINNQQNYCSYIAFIEYGNNKKVIFLEPNEVNDIKYSFENNIPIEEIFDANEINADIKLTIFYLNI